MLPRTVTVVLLGVIVFASFSVSARAQTVGSFESWTERPTRTPAAQCRSLRSATTYEFSVDSATLVPAEGPVPEFCLIEGLINPEVRFEVALPSRWNGRFYMFGNGGFAGEQLTAPGRIQRRSEGLKAGLAVAQTNTGHDNVREPLASFARSPQKLIDFAYRAVHVTALTAKTLIARYYASPPNKSYFAGCSTGGRQGLMSAQRFPADFDGILAGAPVFNFTGILTQFTVAQRALAASTLDPDKVRFLSDAVRQKCDAVDGVADGVIDDPRACSFNHATDVRACAAGENGPSCLTAAEIKVFDAFQRVASGQGEVFPAFPTATAILAPHGTGGGTTPGFWLGPQAGSLRFAENFFRDMATPGTPIDWKTFNVSTDMGKLQATAAVMNAADPDLHAFRRRGGKLLMYHGWAEPQINPMLTVNYYESVRQKIGVGTEDFARLFMMPGVLHCGGGPGPDFADMMTPLIEWVERGTPPARITARKEMDGKAIRTRPLCPYPQAAKYKGSGSTDSAESFACALPAVRSTSD